MRNVTIRRNKSFVGCLAKMKVYIEDAMSSEIVINSTPCRKLGDLKSGEEKTFSVGTQPAKIFVIADQLSKEYCCEYFELPEGEEDILLTGRNRFNLASGNAFRFDHNDSAAVQAHRKQGSRKGLAILIACIAVGLAVGVMFGGILGSGLFGNNVKGKAFTCQEMSITLTNQFYKVDVEEYTAAYGTKDLAVLVLKEDFATAEGFENYTLEQYVDLLLQSNELDTANIHTVDGLTYFEYDFLVEDTNEVYQYHSYVYKAKDAFWLVQFGALQKDFAAYEAQIPQWAKSVTFAE